MRGAGAGGVRRRPVRDALGVLVAAAVLPCGWVWDDPASHLVGATVAFAVGLVVLVGRAQAAAPAHAYADALRRASAVHVHLTRARATCRTVDDGLVLLTFTWQGARTDLLDADGRVLHTVLRNCLDSGYTVTIPVDDVHVADLIVRDPRGGGLDIYAGVDVGRHPAGTVAEHGVVRDEYGLVFAAWQGTITARGAVARVETQPL